MLRVGSSHRLAQAAEVWCRWAAWTAHADRGNAPSLTCLASMRHLSGQPKPPPSGLRGDGMTADGLSRQEQGQKQQAGNQQEGGGTLKHEQGAGTPQHEQKPRHDSQKGSLESISHHLASAVLRMKQQAVSVAQQVTQGFGQQRKAAPDSGQQGAGQVGQATSPEQQGTVLTRFQSKLATTATMLNELTGYSGVEQLKEQVKSAEKQLFDSQATATQKKQDYEASVARQLHMQKELQKLLERKSGWSDSDVHRFAELCRDEARVGASVDAARAASEAAVTDVDTAQKEYMQAMRERYTEEQLWGDKIRRAATWYTWGLMGLQLVSFVGVLLVVEPRRVRLLQDRVKELLEQHESTTAAQVKEQLQAQLGGIQQLLDTQRADVVMHTLDGSIQSAAQAQTGQGEAQAGPDMSKMMSAVVSFMDGVHAELVLQRNQLDRLAAAVQLQHPSQAEHIEGQGEHPEVGMQGQELLVKPSEAGGADGKLVLAGTQHVMLWGRKLSVEQAIGVAAGVSAGVGAFLGVLLASYFSPHR